MNNNVYHVINGLRQKTGVLTEMYIYGRGRKKAFARAKKQNILQDSNFIERNAILNQ